MCGIAGYIGSKKIFKKDKIFEENDEKKRSRQSKYFQMKFLKIT